MVSRIRNDVKNFIRRNNMTSPYILTQNRNPKPAYPVLAKHNSVEYRYTFTEKEKYVRKDMDQEHAKRPDKKHPLPYDFIIGILKHYVHNIDDMKYNTDKVVLSAQSLERGYFVVLLVSMKENLLTVHNIQKIVGNEFKPQSLSIYRKLEHYYFKKLNLDVYLENVQNVRLHYEDNLRKSIYKSTQPFFRNDNCEYYYVISKHAYTKRSPSKGQRLTIPEKAVSDILRYLVKHKESFVALQERLYGVKDEKKIALVFYNRGRNHLIGMLVAFDMRLNDIVVARVITMYDDVPKHRDAQNLLFPKVDRITLYEYDLAPIMEEYDRKEEEKAKRKAQQLEKYRKESKIIKIASFDDMPIIKKANNKNLNRKPIRKIQVKKPIEHNIPSTESKIATRKIWIVLLSWGRDTLSRLINKLKN